MRWWRGAQSPGFSSHSAWEMSGCQVQLCHSLFHIPDNKDARFRHRNKKSGVLITTALQGNRPAFEVSFIWAVFSFTLLLAVRGPPHTHTQKNRVGNWWISCFYIPCQTGHACKEKSPQGSQLTSKLQLWSHRDTMI